MGLVNRFGLVDYSKCPKHKDMAGLLTGFDLAGDITFALGTGLALSALFGGTESVDYVLAGTYLACLGGLIRIFPAYVTEGDHPKEADDLTYERNP